MSIKSFVVIFLLLTIFIYPISCKKNKPLIYQNLEIYPLSEESVLISNATIGDDGWDATRSYYLLDVKTKKTQPIPSQWKGCFDFYVNKYENPDFNDLIGNYKPIGKDFYEIGRFDEKTKQYRTLVADTKVACGLVYDSKKHNTVFYQKGINEQSCQEIWIMDRDGKNNKTITNGFRIQVFECRSINDTLYLIDGLSDYTRNHCFLIYNVHTQKLIVMSDKNLSYDFIDFYNNKILTRMTNSKENTIDVCLIDYNGLIQKTIYTIKDSTDFLTGHWIVDQDNQRLFYSYVTKDHTYKILELSLNNGSEKILFTKNLKFEFGKKRNEYHPSLDIRYNKQINSLFFIARKTQLAQKNTSLFIINLTTNQIEQQPFPDLAYCYSNDSQFIFCIGREILGKSKLFDVVNNQFIPLKENVFLPAIEYIFSDLTKQFIFCPIYVDSTEKNEITFINLDGTIELLQLPISPPK
jgi:hypothetical protein